MRRRQKCLSSSSYLESLPNELLTTILELLEVPTFLLCRRLSHRFNNLIKGSMSLEYLTELFASNLVDGLSSCFPTKKGRLARLREHQIAWNNLDWSEIIPIPLSETELKTPFLTSWELLGGILGLADRRSIRFVQLPSPLRGISQAAWRHEDVGFNIRDFTMDRSLDLVVLLEHADFDGPDSDKGKLRVHLHSLKTGIAHTLARRKILTFTSALVKNEAAPDTINYVLQIYGDILAIMVTRKNDLGTTPTLYSSELILWDWRSGNIQKITHGPIHGFTFLTENLVLLAVCRPDPEDANANSDYVSLDLLSVTGPGQSIDVTPFPDSKNPSLLSLRFPSFASARDLGVGRNLRPELTLRSDSSCSWSDSRDNVPFSTSPSDRLFVLLISNIIPSRESITVFFRLSSLLDLFSTRNLDHPEGFIPWDEWGPKHTRMVHQELDSQWFCYIHGLKALVPSQTKESAVEVWDFNPQACKRGLGLLRRRKVPQPPRNFYPSPSFKRQTYCSASQDLETNLDDWDQWDSKHIFTDKIATSLPYRVQTLVSPLKNERQVFMMTEDCLIAVVDDRQLFALCF